MTEKKVVSAKVKAPVEAECRSAVAPRYVAAHCREVRRDISPVRYPHPVAVREADTSEPVQNTIVPVHAESSMQSIQSQKETCRNVQDELTLLELFRQS